MATKEKTAGVDLNSVFEGAVSQFRGLNPNEPGQWPMLPKFATWGAVAVAMVVLGWFVLLTGAHDQLDAERAKEPMLKADYRGKLGEAVNLTEAKAKRAVRLNVLLHRGVSRVQPAERRLLKRAIPVG